MDPSGASRPTLALPARAAANPDATFDAKADPKIDPRVDSRALQAYLSKLFATIEEAESHFKNLDTYEQEKAKYERRVEKLTPKFLELEAQQQLYAQKISQLGERILFCKKQIDKLNQVTERPSIRSIYLLSKCINDSDPRVRELAKKACDDLKAYNERVLDALIQSGANMDRWDLLKHIYLFAYYGFEPCTNGFTHPDIPSTPVWHSMKVKVPYFVFSFDHDMAYELEREMRRDLKSHNVKLPPRLIKERVYTKPLTAKIQNVQRAIRPVLNRWNTASDSDKAKVIQTLITHNEFRIPCDAFEITTPTTKNPTRITGYVTLGRTRRRFWMKMNDCIIIVPRKSSEINSNRVSTYWVLSEMLDEDARVNALTDRLKNCDL